MPRCGLPAVVLAITELYGKGLVNMNNEIKQQPSAPVASNTKDKPLNSKQPVKKQRRPLLEIKNLTKKYGENTAVNNVDLTIYEGEIFALLGSSGCGKSTLLRMMAGFEMPTSGSIYLDGKDMAKEPPYNRPVNMMFQSYALFPHMTVKQNIAFGLKQDKLGRAEIEERVQKMLKLVHMEEFADRKPHQLSGGQRQRVALARSLAKQPKVLLLDEPMGALDKKLREQMRLELVDIIEKVGVTCVMVTHDQEEAMTMAEDLIAGIVLDEMEEGNKIPEPSKIENVTFEDLEKKLDMEDWDYISKFKTYIAVDISMFAEKWGKELVKKTVNIPKWINIKAEALKINFSKTLEEALLEKIYKK